MARARRAGTSGLTGTSCVFLSRCARLSTGRAASPGVSCFSRDSCSCFVACAGATGLAFEERTNASIADAFY
jgi:hypothetical protein